MRCVLLAALLLALLGAATAQVMPPPPGLCTAFSPTVLVDAAVLAGAHFTAAATCPSSDATACRCIPGNRIEYPATSTHVMSGATCTCTFTAVRDTPADMMTLRACAACA